MSFFKIVLAVIVGFLIAISIFFFVTIAGATAVASSSKEKIEVKDLSVLTIKLDDIVKDYAPKNTNPFSEIMDIDDEKMALNKIINAIENAKTDAKIEGISIETMSLQAGIAQLQAIRDKLLEFKESGKFIVAYADVYDQRNYYLSSVADSIFVNPIGGVDFKGLSTEPLFFKDFEDKYGVKLEVIRHGKYKSAVEPFIASTMSAANREQTTSFLKSIWDELLVDIGSSRDKTSEELNTIADNLAIRTPKLALENNMIDGIVYKDEYRTKLKYFLQLDENSKLNKITLEDYISTGKGRISVSTSNKIAVVYAQGEIKYGEGTEDYVGQGKMVEALHKVAKNDKIDAIVLRVNSPGGSVLASDLIWHAIELAKKEKPVVVSMGNLAASGGYYISCTADKIFAEPTTITGSIGVFGAIPNVSKAADNMGINAERVATNKSAFYSAFESITPEFYNVTKESIENIYEIFVNKVAKGRGMTFEQVDAIAQGRVWTGKQALENGLVDALGSLEDAIVEAAKLAEIDTYKITNYPRFKKDFKEMMNPSSFMSIKNKMIENELGKANYSLYKKVKKVSQYQGIQARMPFDLEIK